jgi:hypothetical protein
MIDEMKMWICLSDNEAIRTVDGLFTGGGAIRPWPTLPLSMRRPVQSVLV